MKHFYRRAVAIAIAIIMLGGQMSFAVSAAQSIDQVIAELKVNTARFFTEEEANVLAARIDDEWLPLAETDLQKFDLHNLKSAVYYNSQQYEKSIVANEAAMQFLPKEAPADRPPFFKATYQKLTQGYYDQAHRLEYQKADASKIEEMKVKALKSVTEVLRIYNSVDDGGLQHWVDIRDELVAEGVKLPATAAITATASTTLRAFFEKYYTNDLMVVEFVRQGSVDQSVDVTAKLAARLNTADLRFYAYNATKNTYSLLSGTSHWVDSNGYVHFKTSQAGAVIISDGLLTK